MTAAAWHGDWAPLIALVGQDVSAGVDLVGPDVVEAGAIRRFLEPLEFDCPLHRDAAAARACGYDDIVAPVSSLTSWTIPPIWRPGPPVFTEAGADAQPRSDASVGLRLPFIPDDAQFFATDYEADYLTPVVVGDRLSRVGRRVLSCEPKETKVGRGVFMVLESDIRNQRAQIVATFRITMFVYRPHV